MNSQGCEVAACNAGPQETKNMVECDSVRESVRDGELFWYSVRYVLSETGCNQFEDSKFK